MSKQRINNIIIHCSDGPNGRDDRVDDIRRWHTAPKPQGRGWKHAGYHYVIELDGHCASLVPLNDDDWLEPWEIANGAYGHNSDSIHICLIGSDQFTLRQWGGLWNIVNVMRTFHPSATIHGHHEFNPAKTCPNFDVKAWLTNPDGEMNRHLLLAE